MADETGRGGSPDPSSRTLEVLDSRVLSLREVIFTRLDAMDKAIAVAHENLVRIPTDTDKQVGHLKLLTEEKFAGIATQFTERDVRVTESAFTAKTAVDAALQAQKEAQGKIEESMTKQVDRLMVQVQQGLDGLRELIAQLDGRTTRIESVSLGATGANVTRQQSGAYVASIVFGVIGVIGLIAGVLLAVLRP